MKFKKNKIWNSILTRLLISLFIISPSISDAQDEITIIKKLLKGLPTVPVSNELQTYRMTAVYTNRDVYGTFIDKVKVSGDYTRGLEKNFVKWNNIYISSSNNSSGPFGAPKKQVYMENIKYVPSPKMLEPGAFKNFPATPEGVFARNLIWDMMAIEGFAGDYIDTLALNKIYRVPETKGGFKMADIGTYAHNKIELSWIGISEINNNLCAVIEYRAIDNKVEMKMVGFEAKGTEQYWGTIFISLKTRSMESAVMYSGTIQEMEISGMTDKIILKTIRELEVDKI